MSTDAPTDFASPEIVLDSEHMRFLAALASAGQGKSATLQQVRDAAAAARHPWQAGGAAMAEIVDITISTETGAVPGRLYRPDAEATRPVVFYIHGGGWTLLGLDTHDRIMREYASASGWTVIGLELPRAPETQFPGAVNTAADTIAAVLSDAARYGIDPIGAIAGDSSGANLALASALVLRDRGTTGISALMLNYGIYDHDLTRPSYAAFSQPPLTLSGDRMAWFWDNYCPDPATRSDPLASPLRADLTALPPVRIVTAGQDVLRDENLALVVRLAEAGNAVSLDHYPHAPHAFIEAIALNRMAGTAIRRSATWLNDMVPAASPETAT